MQRLLVVAALSCAALSGSVHAATESLHPCRVPGFRTEVQCGSVPRALDPAHPQGTQIDVHYVVVPALARRKLADPVFFLAGGPGQSAIGVAPMIAQQMGRLNNRRDLVFVDQRGTGQSAPLMCDEDRMASLAQLLDSKRREQLLRQCLAQLQRLPYGDLRFFTTTLAMQDVDAVRQALGAERINLIGASYGTRAALEYMREFPQAVRRSVIDGVAPPDMVLPASASTDNQAAFDALLAACEQDANCARTYPQLRSDWNSLLASLPKPATVTHPLTGVSEQVTVTRETLLGAVRGPLYSPVTASALPHLSATVDRPGRDFGNEFSQLYVDACSFWPRGSVPPAFYSIPVSESPVLVLSGGIDPVTPPRHGARVAQTLGPMARHVVVPNAGHVVMTLGCMHDVLFRFIDAIDDADAMNVDAGCAAKIPRPPAFVPVSRAQQGAS